MLKKLIVIILIVKISILLAIFLAYHLLPFNVLGHNANFVYPRNEIINYSKAYKTWDGQHYIFLAEQGYAPNQRNNGFYPLWPLAIKVVRPLLGGNSLLAGLLLANLFSLIAGVVFFLLVKNLYGDKIAYYASLSLLAFPSSFYFSLVYSESLCFMLIVLCFYGLYQQKYRLAFLAALLLPLSRPVGLLIAVPALVLLLRNKVKKFKAYFVPCAAVVGWGIYLLMMKYYTGDALTAVAAQKYFVAGHSISNLLQPLTWLSRNFINASFVFHGFRYSILDRVFFVFVVMMLGFIYRFCNKELFVYALCFGLLPALAGNYLASYIRYSLLVMPIFIVLALWLKEKHYYVTIPMSVVQIVFLIAHSLNYWIA